MIAGNKKSVYDFVISYKSDNNGNSPSFRDIGTALEINSTSHIRYLLKELQKEGVLTVGQGARNISVPGYKWVRDGQD